MSGDGLVKRFDIEGCRGVCYGGYRMGIYSDGRYVFAEDYDAMIAKVAELADKWERIGKEHGTRQFTGNDHLLFANELRVRLLAEDK